MAKRTPKTITIEIGERLRLQADHDEISIAEAVKQAIAFWCATREDSIACGIRNDGRLRAAELARGES